MTHDQDNSKLKFIDSDSESSYLENSSDTEVIISQPPKEKLKIEEPPAKQTNKSDCMLCCVLCCNSLTELWTTICMCFGVCCEEGCASGVGACLSQAMEGCGQCCICCMECCQ